MQARSARRRGFGITQRVMGLVVLGVLIFAAQVAALFVLFAEHASRERIDATVKELVAAADRAAGDLRGGDEAQRFGEALALMPLVRAVEIHGHDGALRWSVGAPFAAPPPAQEQTRVQFNSADVEVATQIQRGGEDLHVRFLLGRLAIAPEERLGRLALLVFGLAFSLAVALPLAWLAARRITSPLEKLTTFAAGVSADGGVKRVDIRTGDEIETLAVAFNDLIAKLDGSLRRLRRLAFIDQTTDLPNQDRFRLDLRAHFEALGREGAEAEGAVLALSVGKLSAISDSLGHDAGEALLAMAAKRLLQAARTADRVVRPARCEAEPTRCARLPGLEFAALIPCVDSAAEAARFAQLVCSALRQPIDFHGHKITLSPTIGAAIIPRDAADAESALRHARLALNAAGEDGRPVRFFTQSLDTRVKDRLALERDMREAIERGEFRAFFQPKIDLMTGRICGAEALARWIRPDRAVIGPAKFIPAAEENGLIAQLAEMILRDACWRAAAWAREGTPLRIAVNVSPLQFEDERFPAKVLAALDHAGLAPELLELEVTESVAVTNVERVLARIEPLRLRGVRFAIDDFGTGHSSLAALSRLPFDVLKIDQQFIRGLAADRHAPAIVETILAMAASLDFATVAEGVETEKQAAFLRMRGCAIGQGYLWGAPVPPAEFQARLRAEFAIAAQSAA